MRLTCAALTLLLAAGFAHAGHNQGNAVNVNVAVDNGGFAQAAAHCGQAQRQQVLFFQAQNAHCAGAQNFGGAAAVNVNVQSRAQRGFFAGRRQQNAVRVNVRAR